MSPNHPKWRAIPNREENTVEDKARRSTVACIVTEHEAAVIEALAFLGGRTKSDILYEWLKPHIEEAAKSPEVQKVLALRVKPEPAEEIQS